MSNYMYVEGKKIKDKDGNDILLRGVGLGGWMLPEGYMWGSHGYYNRPRRFEELVSYYLDTEASSWWNTYYKTWISDQDFNLIKEHGYNSVRLPMNYRLLMNENDSDETVTLNEYGFNMIDYTIEQCEKNGLYLILDLHGAPGGQTGANIDDSKDDYPHLFEEEKYQIQFITLWEEIARRYRDNETICMYDLINEPIPEKFKHLNDLLEPLHEKTINAIRAIDTNHIICIEGNNWASQFETITKKLDENMVLHFHKYWNPPSIEQIQRFLDKREEFDLPLFMGEGGENDLYWYSSNFKMYEQLDISWNFWAYKKRENHNSIISFDLPKNWRNIFDKENRIPKEQGRELLYSFLENIKFENCKVNNDVTNSLFYKDEFFTSGGIYDYLGRGKSFMLSEEFESSTIRKGDKTHICNADGNEFKGVWGCHNKEQQELELFPYVKGNPGDIYKYSFKITKNHKETKTITITHKDLDADFYINGEIIEVENADGIYTLEFKGRKGLNRLTIEPVNNGVIKIITFK